ncbi:MAG: efflux RND transporter periplasmic adaptor subunit [Bacillota bacterium]
MRKRIISYLALLGLIAVLLSGCGEANRAVTVSTAVGTYEALELPLQLGGVLLPSQTVDISSKVTGKVVSLNVRTGSVVKPGDVLITLDSELIGSQIAQAQASLCTAEAALQAARNQAEIARVGLEAAQRSYDRIKALYDSGASSQAQLEDAEDRLTTAQKQYETACGPAQQQAQAAVDLARANLESLKIQQANTIIKSPIAGILACLNVDEGEILSPGVVAASVIDTSNLKLKTSVNQENLALITEGQEMDISIDGNPGIKLKGTVSSVGPVSLNTGQVFPVEITIKNNGHLKAGLAAHAVILAKSRGITVPSSAVVSSNGKNFVFVIENHSAYRREVKIGPKNERKVIILEGLKEGEMVAVTNVRTLADKMTVKVQPQMK